jgi:hypothetical protein
MLKHIVALTLILLLPAVATAVSLPETGQTVCYDAAGAPVACAGTGQDGDLLKGVAWPATRFTDNGNGTVFDNLTGLIWLKNANCYATQDWPTAVASANALADGICGLTDGSTAGQWRLPNRKELQSLIDRSQSAPPLTAGHPFTAVQTTEYWSSSTYNADTTLAWNVLMTIGSVETAVKTNTYRVWAVRGGW